MKLTSHTSAIVTTETYSITDETYGPLTYIEYLNDKGKVIDCTLRDEDGNDIDNPPLLEELQQFVDGLEQGKEDAKEHQRRDEKRGLYSDREDFAN